MITKEDFILEVLNKTPPFIKIGDIEYMQFMEARNSGFCSVGYVEYNGDNKNWDNQIIKSVYKISSIVNLSQEPDDDKLKGVAVYKTTIQEAIEDFKFKLSGIRYEVFYEVLTKEDRFKRELQEVINRHSKESGSNTPDYVLADYLIGCLNTFNDSVNAMEKHYGREKAPEWTAENREDVNSK
jgi:hypothetical protein